MSGNFKEDDEHPIELFRQFLDLYKGIDKDQLRKNMKYFLEAIMPVCEETGINMCVHPDDPPIPVLGLPRIVNSDEDIEWFLKAVDNPHNGLTFCAGSLSAGIQGKKDRDQGHQGCFLLSRGIQVPFLFQFLDASAEDSFAQSPGHPQSPERGLSQRRSGHGSAEMRQQDLL